MAKKLVFNCAQKNKAYPLNVQPQTQIWEMTNYLHEDMQCSKNEKCVLYFKNQELQNNQTFDHIGIVDGSQIEIKIEEIQQFQFTQNQNEKHQYSFVIPVKNVSFRPKPINPLDKGKVAYDFVRDQSQLSNQEWEVQIYHDSVLLLPEKTFKEQGILNETTFTVNIKSNAGYNLSIQS